MLETNRLVVCMTSVHTAFRGEDAIIEMGTIAHAFSLSRVQNWEKKRSLFNEEEIPDTDQVILPQEEK